jgi:colicin import membrane protein
MPPMHRLSLLLCGITFGCVSFGRPERSADQIAAERALIAKKTALLERENQVLREENLEITRASELQKADQEKKQAAFSAAEEKRIAQLKATETAVANLTEKLKILESDSGGKIRQLTQLNEQVAEKAAETQKKLQEEISRLQIGAAREKEQLSREAAEKQFAQSKEIQEFRQRLAEKEKELEDLRREVAALKNKQPAAR